MSNEQFHPVPGKIVPKLSVDTAANVVELVKLFKKGMDTLEAVAQVTSEYIGKVFDRLDELLPPGLSLEKVAQAYSAATDRIILDAERKENLKFVGGKLTIAAPDAEEFVSIKAIMYFQNDAGSWFNKEAFRRQSILRFSEDAVAELIGSQGVSYEIVPPASEGVGGL